MKFWNKKSQKLTNLHLFCQLLCLEISVLIINSFSLWPQWWMLNGANSSIPRPHISGHIWDAISAHNWPISGERRHRIAPLLAVSVSCSKLVWDRKQLFRRTTIAVGSPETSSLTTPHRINRGQCRRMGTLMKKWWGIGSHLKQRPPSAPFLYDMCQTLDL